MRRLTTALALSFTAACGGGNSSTPTAPSPPPVAAAPTVANVTISGLDAIRSGFFSNFTATANMSNGTSQPVTATWSSDNSGVASVATNGDVTGVSNGVTTIAATYLGVRGSRAVRIVANFGGSWSGTYRMNKCDEAGSFRGWCSGLGGTGALLPISLNLTQGGNSRDLISGQLSLGSIAGNISGNVTGDGRLILGGTFTFATGGTTAVLTFGGWDTRLSGASGMTGQWAHTLQATGLTGNAYQENSMVTMSHTSAGTSAPTRDVGVAVGIAGPNNFNLTLEQAASRMRHP